MHEYNTKNGCRKPVTKRIMYPTKQIQIIPTYKIVVFETMK
jgi:hypothetical protein